jgi:hypothetical protein
LGRVRDIEETGNMASTIRLLILLVIAVGLHQFPGVRNLEQAVLDLPGISNTVHAATDVLDKRPEVAVLLIGNSRTFYNDMPAMVGKMADSAHDKFRYRIAMYALGGASLQDHWRDPKVHELLREKWDYVVLQGGSSEQINATMESSFHIYGSELATLVKSGGAKPVFFVAWRCLPGYYPELRNVSPQAFYYAIQNSYYQVAHATGAASVNVGKGWERVLEGSTMPLFVDGNHPNMRGSYLTALMFYRFFSGDDLKNVTWMPDGVTPEDAAILKIAALEQ